MNNLLKGGTAMGKPRSEATLEDIRQTMLNVLGDHGGRDYPVIQLRVTYAEDVQDLWYLRGDVMAAVAAMRGEAIAREQLANISGMFKGLVPNGLTTRQSPLGR